MLVTRWRCLIEPSIDVYSFVVSLGWTILLLVADLFGRPGSYGAMRAVGSEYDWAVIIGVGTLVQLAGIVVREPPVRFLAQTGASAQWMFIAIMLSDNGVRTGAVVYGSLALFLMFRTVRSET